MLKNKNLSTATRTSSIRAVLDDFKQTSTARQTHQTLKHNTSKANQSTAIFQHIHQNRKKNKKKTTRRYTGDKELVIGNRRGRTGFRRKNSMGRRIGGLRGTYLHQRILHRRRDDPTRIGDRK